MLGYLMNKCCSLLEFVGSCIKFILRQFPSLFPCSLVQYSPALWCDGVKFFSLKLPQWGELGQMSSLLWLDHFFPQTFDLMLELWKERAVLIYLYMRIQMWLCVPVIQALCEVEAGGLQIWTQYRQFSNLVKSYLKWMNEWMINE